MANNQGWSIVDNTGSLPDGLELIQETGEITGTPTEYGIFEFTIKLENDCGEITRPITIIVCGDPEIADDVELEFIKGESGQEEIEYKGIPGKWSVVETTSMGSFEGESFNESFETLKTITLPEGLTLDPDTGEVYGTPTEYGVFVVRIKFENVCGEDEKDIIILVCGKPDITTSEVYFTKGEEGSQELISDGTPGTWSVIEKTVGGSFHKKHFNKSFESSKVIGLPDGLSLDPDTGVISGTPTKDGTFKVNIKNVNSCGEHDQEITIIIESNCYEPNITTTELVFEMGEEDSQQLLSSGSPGIWSITSVINVGGDFDDDFDEDFNVGYDGELPDGLVLDPDTGMISGTPITDGEYQITVKNENDCGEDETQITIRIVTTYKVIFNVFNDKTNAPITNSTISVVDNNNIPIPLKDNGDGSYHFTLQAGEYTYTVSKTDYYTEQDTIIIVGDETEDVHVNIGLKSIYHTLTFYVVDEFDVPVIDATIDCLDYEGTPLTVTNNSDGTYEVTVVNGTYDYTISKLGYISVIDDVTINKGDVSVNVKIQLACVAPTITSTNTADFVMGESGSKQLTATGSVGTWSVDSSTPLPTGLSLNTSTGLISGAPTTAGGSIIIKYTNVCGEATQIINIIIYEFDVDSNYKLFGTNGGTWIINITSKLNNINHPWKYV